MNRITQLSCFIATLGKIGFIPPSGTIASIVATIILFFLPQERLGLIGLLIILTIVAGYYSTKYATAWYKSEDPKCIVIDELLGCMITFFAIKRTLALYIMGFLLFRFFDISKIGPISWAEKCKGPWGVLLDDMVAGIVSNGVLHGIMLCML